MTPVEDNIQTDRKNLLKGYNMLLYFAGSMILYEPTEECVTDFFSNGILKKLPVSSNNPNFIRGAALLRESCSDRDLCREVLIRDYKYLFSSDGLQLAIPRESAYPGYSITYGSKEKVGEFYDSYGWGSRPGHKAPDDHLGIELLFLTKLIDKYLQFDDEPCCCEMKKEIHRFIGQHIITWLPEWNRRMQDNAKSIYYRGIGNLVLACIEDLYGIFEYQGKAL
ncbi:MAG: molecular chaperone TorD family protein [Bacteroidia bacterium]|nr:molecular chaperone TorD family protein [Bacteroidia bacterium]